MLRAELSPFSTLGRGSYLGNVATHFVFLNRFSQRAHLQGIQNFLAGYFASLGSPLLTFSADPEISRRVRLNGLPVIESYVDDLNPGFVSVQPARILGQGGSALGGLERGAVLVGLQWEPRSTDLDLHISLAGKPERLSFRAPQTPFGTLQKQFETGWEEAYLTADVPPEALEIVVNFYGGTAPPEGIQAEVQLVYAGTLYRQQLTFQGQGNRGQVGSEVHWQRVEVSALMQQRQ